MIQRIQSIFLLLSSATMGLLFAVPFATSEKTDTAMFSDKIYNVYDHPALMAIAGLAGLLALINIFLFKKRGVQIRLDYLYITLGVVLLALVIFLIFGSGKVSSADIGINENYLGLGLPIVGIICAFLANRFINKDQKIVKSMDRLR
jgi:hypothetical protein